MYEFSSNGEVMCLCLKKDQAIVDNFPIVYNFSFLGKIVKKMASQQLQDPIGNGLFGSIPIMLQDGLQY